MIERRDKKNLGLQINAEGLRMRTVSVCVPVKGPTVTEFGVNSSQVTLWCLRWLLGSDCSKNI